ncbi:hypothetical protein F7984_16110 [Pradoshia sp. D12]|uniref:hypothetical protein n=1 Tax=Bacillaceae TaxID=186817 RepID=UPI00112E268D|nr:MULTISPECIES: hypothetical protein [Bacillaceae]QFK72640.1 hypothetical protein F7984_16110 [Pradoshia sp. D12]TPF71634.1 hypothetical protein FHY44_08810 [Bacillus sp. D12]
MPNEYDQQNVNFPHEMRQQGYYGSGYGHGQHGHYGGGMGHHQHHHGYHGGMGYPHYSGGGYGHHMPYHPGHHHHQHHGYGGGHGFPHHGWQGQQWGQGWGQGQSGYGGFSSQGRDPYSYEEFATDPSQYSNPYYQY